MPEKIQRKLAAIVSADVVGYSRLMGADETGTLAAMRAHRTELWNPIIERYGGRVVGTAGDSLLIEYASAVAAVESSVVVQRGMIERNAGLPDVRRMLLRIGVNIGEVVIDGDDIFGDGVNVAARLQAIADGGGVAISSNIHEQVSGKLDVTFSDDGEHEVKNIDRPVHVWRWTPDTNATADDTATVDQPLSLPDKPSIAVLPFDNMSDDPGQEYFSDGIAEDIITALSRFHQFFVVARNSSFTYKGRAVEVKEVARELGVQYVIEGSVRRGGNRVRITVQLIDAVNDHHIWAERYDRELDDIFAIQDEITERIAVAVGPELNAMEIAHTRRKNVPDLNVWELVARAHWHGWKWVEKETAMAVELLHKALEIDPNSATVHAWLSGNYLMDGTHGWRRPRADSFALALDMGQKAVDLDKEDELAHVQLGFALYYSRRHEEAIERFRTALKLNSNYAYAMGGLGQVLIHTHNYEEGLELLHKVIQLSPKDPMRHTNFLFICVHHYNEERYDEALAWAKKSLHEKPNFAAAYIRLAATYGQLGNLDDARAAYAQYDRLVPGATIAPILESVPFAFDEDAEHLAEGLRFAGVPEE